MTDARQVFSASEVVRSALRGFGEGLMADIAPAAIVMGELLESGEAPSLQTLGLAWGTTEETHTRPLDEDAFDDGRGVWLLHYEETQGAFIWRGKTPEDADYYAHQFCKRATRAAQRSNPDGDRVLHFTVEIDGISKTAKLYLAGRVVPDEGSGPDNLLRSLYTFRVPFAVAYPVIDVEDLGDATGLMNIVVVIDGASYSLADIVEA